MVFYGDKDRGEYNEVRSTYEPKQAHFDIAKEYGVIISASTNKLKKLNVYKPITGVEMVSEITIDGVKKTLAFRTKTGKLRKKRSGDKDYVKIAEIGGMYQDGVPYGDYFTYLENPTDRYGNDVDAEEAKDKYLKRHQHENKINKKAFETFDEEGDIKKEAIDLGSPSFWADVILWGAKANQEKLVMKKDFAKLDQNSATHAITDDFEFDLEFAKIMEKRIKKLKNFIQFSKKFEEKNEKLLKDYISKNRDVLISKFSSKDIYNFWDDYDDKEWSSKFYTVGQFKDRKINEIKSLFYEAKANTAVFERQLLFNQKILNDYNKRLKDGNFKQLGQNIATNKEIAKLAEEANEETLKSIKLSGKLEDVIKEKFDAMTEAIEENLEPAEYGNEGGKMFAKTLKLKDGSEINVMLNENEKLNLNSMVMDTNGEFIGALRDFYDQLKDEKLELKGKKFDTAKEEYEKVLEDFLVYRKTVDDILAKYADKNDMDDFEGDEDAQIALEGSDSKVKKEFDTVGKLLRAYKSLDEVVKDFRKLLPKEDKEKFMDEVNKTSKPLKLEGRQKITDDNVDKKQSAKEIKKDIKKGKEKMKVVKEGKKLAKKLNDLYRVGESMWQKTAEDDEVDYTSEEFFNTRLSKQFYDWTQDDVDYEEEEEEERPKTVKEWKKAFEPIIETIQKINDAFKKAYDKKIPKDIKSANVKVKKLQKQIEDMLDDLA